MVPRNIKEGPGIYLKLIGLRTLEHQMCVKWIVFLQETRHHV